MPEQELIGPFELTISSIDERLENVVSAGVVVFGCLGPQGTWTVLKVDRSDVHIRARLWANMADFTHYSYHLCGSAHEAYNLHCELYHSYKPSYGQHPQPPEGSSLQCPVCSGASNGGCKEDVA